MQELILVEPFAWYARKSDSKSDLQRQRDLLTTYCVDNDYTVADELRFEDTGSRDKATSRPSFQAMLKAAERGRFKTLLIPCLDRLGIADTDDLFRYRTRLLDCGVRIYSIDPSEGDLSSKSYDTLFKLVLKAEASREEQVKKGGRAITGKLSRLGNKATASWMGGPSPYGYDKRCTNQAGELLWQVHSQGKGRRLVTLPDGSDRRVDGDKDTHPAKGRYDLVKLVPSRDVREVQAVKDIFRWWTTEDLAILAICKRLNGLGSRRYAEQWNAAAVRGILANPVYVGSLVYNRAKAGRFAECVNGKEVHHTGEDRHKRYWRDRKDWVTVPDQHPPLIEPDTFKAAQGKLEAVKEGNRRPPRHGDLWLRRYAVCGQCGEHLQARHINGHAYLFCSTSRGENSVGVPTTCTFNSVRADWLEAKVAEHFGDVLAKLGDEDADSIRDALKTYRTRLTDSLAADEGFFDYLCGEVAGKYGVPLTDDGPVLRYQFMMAEIDKRPDAEAVQTFMARKIDRWDADRRADIAKLEAEHERLTERWAEASAAQVPILKRKCDKLEAEIETARRAVSANRIADAEELVATVAAFIASAGQLVESMRGGNGLAKSEAMRPLLEKVVVHFEAKATAKAKSKVARCEWLYSDSYGDGARGYRTILSHLLARAA